MPLPARLHELFDAWLQRSPDRVFLHDIAADGQPQDIDFAALGRLVDAAQAELLALDVRAGDRVLIVAENCPAHVALILACSRIGAWSCGINARMAPGEVAGIDAKADARLVFYTAAASRAAAAHAARQGAQASVLPGVLRSAVRPAARAERGALAAQVAAVIFTSGTTGQPKGVMMTHAGVLHFARASAASRALTPDDRAYACLPMTHIFGLGTVLLASMHAGASVVMRRQFDPADVLDALARQGLSQLQGPPTLFARLLAHLEQQGLARPPAPRLRYLYTGAGPLDPVLKRRVEAAFGLPLHHGYGLSEYAGSVCLGRLGQWRDDTSAGYPVDGAELCITDPVTGARLGPGQRGEIWLRGVGLMPGYFNDPEATAAVMRQADDGRGDWYASGDLGERAEDGALFVVGRLKEMIIRSGFNVYPGEVEAVLNGFPAVARSAVVGRPESDGNEEVLAFVELRHGADLDQEALRAYLSERLAPYKRPSQVRVIGELPMTSNGKILKRQLVEQAGP